MANSSISLTSLDFDTLKSNLKTYMKSQSIFKDYDFEGSNINVLLDVLSYNTYLNSFYLNMVSAESFLDSAQLRDSVVSHAKSLNYIPSSMKSPEAAVNITFTTSGILSGTFTVPKGTQFSGLNANGSFTYVTDVSSTISSTNGTFVFTNVAIYEGSYINESFIVDYTIESQKFMLSNPLIDTDSLSVILYENNGSVATEMLKTSTLYDLNSNSNIFFLQAAQNNQYEIVFGDGVFGRYPMNNSTVLASYRVTQGTSGGGVTTFYIDQDLGPINGGAAVANVVTINTGSNGANTEDIESIRFRAPRAFQTQDRAVTANDYKTLVLDTFNEIKDVHVYGYEPSTNNSVGGDTIFNNISYGTVFISPTTYSGSALSNQRKSDLISFLNTKKIINITNQIIDPDYLYIIPSINLSINFNNTKFTSADFINIFNIYVNAFNSTYLQIFNNTFRYSKFLTTVNNSDNNIIGSSVNLIMYKKLLPTLGVEQSLFTGFSNAIVPGTVHSSDFLTSDGNTYQLTDYNPYDNTFVKTNDQNNYSVKNQSPVLYLKQITAGKVNYTSVGTIIYETGTISISKINVIDFLNEPGIKLFATPVNYDIACTFNNVAEIDIGSVNITTTSV